MIIPSAPTGSTGSTGSTGGAAPSLAPQPTAPTQGGSWLVEFARLVRWELFLAWRRRAMMITLGSLLLVGYVLIVLFQFGVYISETADGQAGAAQGDGLTFPGAMSIGGGYVTYIGLLLFVVLAGALIGSEYSYSTLRLSLARGVGRGRLLAAQIVALALMALGLTALMLLLGALVGLLGTAGGLPQTSATIDAALFGELFAYWLALALNIFVYGLIALWIGTLSRSVAGAIAAPLVFIFVEVVGGEILTAIAAVTRPGTLVNLIAHIPEYLLGVNVGALISLAGDGPYPLTNSQFIVSLPHALIVTAVYVALFIGISYLALAHRDILE